MKKVLGTAKRTLAVLLSTAVILTSLPQAGLSAYAASPDDSITENTGNHPPQADFSDVEETENVGETTGDDETVSEGNASEDSNEDANADENVSEDVETNETDNNAADDEGAADTETNDAESKDSDVEDTDIEDADSENSEASNSNSNDAEAEEEIFAEVNNDGDEYTATVTIPIPYDDNGGKKIKPGTAVNLYISNFQYETGDGTFKDYNLPSTINGDFRLDDISIPVPLNTETNEGTLRFKVEMADNYRLDGVWNVSYDKDVTSNDEGVYELTINGSGETQIVLNHSRLYPISFVIDGDEGDEGANAQILYCDNDGEVWKDAEPGDEIILPIHKIWNGGRYQNQSQSQRDAYDLKFRVIPGDGLVVRTPSANSAGMAVRRDLNNDGEEPNARAYDLIVKNESSLNESTKVFVPVEKPNDYTLKFDYPENMTSVSVYASDGDTPDALELTDKSVKVSELKSVYFSVELNDTSKTILVQYDNDEEIAILSPDEVNDTDSDDDGITDSITYEYTLGSLISDTDVSISVVDNYEITFEAPYGINGLEIINGDDWYGLDFEFEDEDSIATNSVAVPAGSQLDFVIYQDRYDHAEISINVDGNNGDEVTSRYNEEWGTIYTFIPTGNATITFGIEPAEFIFDYDETEVELYVYDTDSEDDDPLVLSENKSINGGYDRSLRIKVKPIGENKRVDLRYNSWYDGTQSPYCEDIDDDGYFYYEMGTGDAVDHKLTIVCYDTCTITFEHDGDAADNIEVMRMIRAYDDEDYYWDYYDGDDEDALIADIGREYYFITNYFNPENYKQSCSVTTGDTTEQLEVYDYNGDRWSETKEPVYCLIPTGDTTVTITRAELKTYEVTVVEGEHVTSWNSNYSNTSAFNVKEDHLLNIYQIDVEEDYTASVTYTVGNGEVQEAKALYGEYRSGLTGIYYSIEITGDTTVYINTELTSSYDVTFENADELDGVKIWAAGTYSLENSDELEGNKISLKNDNLYYFSITPKDGKLIDSIVCTKSGTTTVLEKTTYFFEDEGLTLDCYALGGGNDIKEGLTIKVNLSDGYTLVFEATGFDAGDIDVYSRSDYYYDEDEDEDVYKNITSEKIGLPLNAGYSFFVTNDSEYEYDVNVDSDAVILTKSYEYINYDDTTIYTVSPKAGAELPKKVTISITKRTSEKHNITVNYPDTIRSVIIGSYDEGYYEDYRVKNGTAISVDSSVNTLRLVPVNGYTATVTIKGASDTTSSELTPYRNNMNEKEYYIGSVSEDMTITVETSKGIWQPAYHSVGFFPKRAQIIDSEYKTPFEVFDYDEEDPDSEYYFEEYDYPYYVTRGQSISFYANPYYGYAVESVYAAGVEVIPEWDETLYKYVYTVTPTKNTLIVVNTKPVDPNNPVDPDDPTNPDNPDTEYDVTFSYPETVTGITFKNNAYTLTENRITVKSGAEVAFKPALAEGYKISFVKANGATITADSSGYYTVTVSAATEIVISAVTEGTITPDPDAEYNVNFTYPETVTGITFKNNAYTLTDNKITVKSGTEVAFKPEPAEGYKISYVRENSVKISAEDDGYYKVTVSADTTIDISAVRESTPTYPDYLEKPDDKDAKKGIQISGLKESYVYTGANIVPEIGVWDLDIDDGVLLSPSVDYTLKYKNNKNISEGSSATVTVTGKGNYAGTSITAQFKIEAAKNPLITKDEDLADLKGAKIGKIAAVDYNGEYQYPDFTLTLKTTGASETYRYDPSRENYFVLQGENITDTCLPAKWALSNNRNKGTATLLLTGKKDAKDKATTVKTTFKINALDLSKESNVAVKILDESDSIVYSINGTTPEVEVKVGEKTLINGTDYTVKYASNKKATDSAKVTITGKGNYAKKPAQQPTFKINKLNMGNLKVSAVTAYDGIKVSQVKATVIDDNNGILKASQYTIEVYKVDENGQTQTTALPKTQKLNSTEIKSIRVVATAKDKKNLVENSSTSLENAEAFNVGKNIAKAKFKIEKSAAKIYKGTEVKLEDADLTVTIKENGTTKELHMLGSNGGKDEYYEIIEYSNNIKKGTATAVIRGVGEYSGTKTVKFKIVAKAKK